jgi:HD-like signal output (HDOD) protein
VKRILFVDDEPNVLEGIERMLFSLRKEWHMAFARSGQEALERMETEPFDVIVSDMRMPGMDGAALLTEVTKRYPQTVRFVLTGQSDKETVFRSVGPAHQFLAKPCNPKELKSCVDRAFALRDLLNSKLLKQLVSQIETLPALPKAYARLIQELQSPESSVAAVGKIIETDVAMTAKVLQLVNSAFFGLRQPVSSAVQAVTFLGLDTIKGLVLIVGAFSRAGNIKLTTAFSLDALWQHSMLVGAYAEAIGRNASAAQEIVKDAFTAGLLHDSGMLILAENCTDAYKEILDMAEAERLPLEQVEQAALGCTHAEVGAYLLGIWGLPDSIVEAVAFHHKPSLSVAAGFSTLTAVHVGNAIAHEIPEATGAMADTRLDLGYLDTLGLREQVFIWRKACGSVQSGKENMG